MRTDRQAARAPASPQDRPGTEFSNLAIRGRHKEKNEMIRTSFVSNCLAAAAMFAFAQTAVAADITIEERMAEEPGTGTVVYWGVDLSKNHSQRHGYGIDGGFVTALDGDLSTTGWTLSGNIGFGNVSSSDSETDSLYGTLLLGHLWVAPTAYFSLAGGVHYVDNDETPPGGATDGHEVGAIAQYGFETTVENAFYAQSYGAISTAYDQLYAHLKLGYKTDQLRFGAEFTVFDDEDGDGTRRYGVFIGDIPITDKLSMVVSGGYQEELDPGIEDGLYATVGFSIPITTR